MDQPLVSIIIALYNAERYISETIRSAVNQTWQNIEIIVVDDGSTDGSYDIAKQFESDNVKVFRQKNKGQCAATNRGLEMASGEYIQYLDADDILSPSKIEQQVTRLLDNPNSIAIGPWAIFNSSTEQSEMEKNQTLWKDADPVDWIVSLWTDGGMMVNCGYLIPRHIIERAGPYDETLNYNNDFEYFPRTILKCKRVLFCPDALSYYRRGQQSSLSQQKSFVAMRSCLSARIKAIDNLLLTHKNQNTIYASATTLYNSIYFIPSEYKELHQEALIKLNSYKVSKIYMNPKLKKTYWSYKLFGWRNTLLLKKISDFMKFI